MSVSHHYGINGVEGIVTVSDDAEDDLGPIRFGWTRSSFIARQKAEEMARSLDALEVGNSPLYEPSDTLGNSPPGDES